MSAKAKTPPVNLCMQPDCGEFASFGFRFGAVWLCGEHRKDYQETEKREAMSRGNANTGQKQGRLI